MAGTPETEHPHKAFGWAARDSSGVLAPFNFSRRFLDESTFLEFKNPLFFFIDFDR